MSESLHSSCGCAVIQVSTVCQKKSGEVCGEEFLLTDYHFLTSIFNAELPVT